MKKWIIIVVIAGLFAWATFDFIVGSTAEEVPNTQVDSENVTEDNDVGLKKGQLAPDFELETLDGKVVKLSDFKGQKVLLNFWATWCPPCRAEMPDMQKFHEDYEDAVILAVNLAETELSQQNVEDFLDEYGVTFNVLSDSDSRVATIYNATALPTSYLINSKGEIHNIARGALNYDQMVQAFDEME